MLPDVVAVTGRVFLIGDRKSVGVKNVRSATGARLLNTIAEISLYDSTRTPRLLDAQMAVDYNVDRTRLNARYTLRTGSGGIITGSGTYQAVYKLTFPDGSVYSWEEQIVVKPRPF